MLQSDRSAGFQPAVSRIFNSRAVGTRCLFSISPLLFTFALLVAQASLPAATLSDPQVDAYNVRVGTQTFSGLYKFTTNTLIVETAQAIQDMGSDILKFYLGPNTFDKSGVTLPPNVTNLITLARDEPNYRKVFDMPFRHLVVWTYPFSTGIPFQ